MADDPNQRMRRVVSIVSARPEDAGELSAIARAAKGSWGYPEAWLRSWEGILTLSPEYIRTTPTFVAVVDEHAAGFGAVALRGNEAFVDHLWVLPSERGRGVGRALFEYAENLARAEGAARLRIESDPHAEGFYIRMGATRYGSVPAPMDGAQRHLPLLQKRL